MPWRVRWRRSGRSNVRRLGRARQWLSSSSPARAEPETADLTTGSVDHATRGAPRPIVVLAGSDPLRQANLTGLVRSATRSELRAAAPAAGAAEASCVPTAAAHALGPSRPAATRSARTRAETTRQ